MASINFEKIIKETPLDIRIRVRNETAFINLLTELGYRENKMWTPEESKTFNRLMKLADKHTTEIFEIIKEWESDGSPQKQ